MGWAKICFTLSADNELGGFELPCGGTSLMCLSPHPQQMRVIRCWPDWATFSRRPAGALYTFAAALPPKAKKCGAKKTIQQGCFPPPTPPPQPTVPPNDLLAKGRQSVLFFLGGVRFFFRNRRKHDRQLKWKIPCLNFPLI